MDHFLFSSLPVNGFHWYFHMFQLWTSPVVYHTHSGHSPMYLNPCRVAPSPQFGLLVTGTGKRLLYGCSFILTWSLGQISPISGYMVTLDLCQCLTTREGLGCSLQPASGLHVNFCSTTGQVPCGAISVFLCFFDFRLLFLYSGHFLMVEDT
jgi:hypothetical protein